MPSGWPSGGSLIRHAPAPHPPGRSVAAERSCLVGSGFRDWAATAPDEVTALWGCTTLPASEHTPPEIYDTPFVVVGAVYSGDVDEGMRLIQPLRELGTPLADISQPLPFSAIQAAFDPFFVRGTLRSYWKSAFVQDLGDEVVDIVVDKAQDRPSKRTFVVVFLMGGAINRVGAEDTAYSERSANWMVSIDGNWEDPADDERVVAWARQAWSEVHKLGTGTTYLNFTGLADETADAERPAIALVGFIVIAGAP